MQSLPQKTTVPVVLVWLVALAFVLALYLMLVSGQTASKESAVPAVKTEQERPFARRQPVQFEQYKTSETPRHE
jgi:hypothetical protein